MNLIDRTNFSGDREIYNGAVKPEIDFVSEKIKVEEKMDQDDVNKGKKTPKMLPRKTNYFKT